MESLAYYVISHPDLILYTLASEDEEECHPGNVAKPIPKHTKKQKETERNSKKQKETEDEWSSSDEEERDRLLGVERVRAFFKKDFEIIKRGKNMRKQ